VVPSWFRQCGDRMIPDIPELEDYGLDFETGFMPAEPPLQRLEDPYYGSWEKLMDRFNGLVLVGRLREAINQASLPLRNGLQDLTLVSYLFSRRHI